MLIDWIGTLSQVSCSSILSYKLIKFISIIFQVNNFALSGGRESTALEREYGANIDVSPFPVFTTTIEHQTNS